MHLFLLGEFDTSSIIIVVTFSIRIILTIFVFAMIRKSKDIEYFYSKKARNSYIAIYFLSLLNLYLELVGFY